MKMLRLMIIGSLLLLVAACGTKQEQSVSKELDLEAGHLTKLVIDNRNGEIEIVGRTDSDQIEVKAQARASGVSLDKAKLALEEQGDSAYLNASFEAQFFSMGSGSVDLQIKAPKYLRLDISHRDGKVNISGMSSEVRIDNINGDLQVADTAGPIDIGNRDGDIDVRDIASDVKIDNINGHISIDRVGGSAEVHVGDGSLDIGHVAKDASITQSGNGKVNIGEVKGKVTQNK